MAEDDIVAAMKAILPLLMLLAACAAPPPAPPSHDDCRKALAAERSAHLAERFRLLDELVNAHQAAFDREVDLVKKREILELQQRAVQRMIETRNEMRHK
jgi:hypothetical protein